MPLSDEQRAEIEKVAAKEGVDPAKLAAAAERIVSGQPARVGAKAGQQADHEQPKLDMYLLPFVTVQEVREHWLGLTDAFPGDRQVASKWAAANGGDMSTRTAPGQNEGG